MPGPFTPAAWPANVFPLSPRGASAAPAAPTDEDIAAAIDELTEQWRQARLSKPPAHSADVVAIADAKATVCTLDQTA